MFVNGIWQEKEQLMYKSYTNELFSYINIPMDALLCTNVHCKEYVNDVEYFSHALYY